MMLSRFRLRHNAGITKEPRRSGAYWYRPVAVGLTAVLLALAAVELVYGLFGPSQWVLAFGDDLAIYTRATARLFAGDNWYLERQMEPYVITGGDVLYPPVTAWFFAPWVVLGPTLYLAAGIGLLGWLVVSWRPAPWTWPLIALCVLWPTSLLKVWSGNPSLWIAVATGLGLRCGVGSLVLLKLTFLPFALGGIQTRQWWVTLAALGVLSLPFLADTLLYPRVLLDARGSTFLYSLWDWPLALIPVVAWLGADRQQRRVERVGREQAEEAQRLESGLPVDHGHRGVGIVKAP